LLQACDTTLSCTHETCVWFEALNQIRLDFVTNTSLFVDEGSPVFAMLCVPSLRLQPFSIKAKPVSKRGVRAPRCVANDGRPEKPTFAKKTPSGRRELMLNSSSLLVLGGLFDNALGGMVDNSRPGDLGLAQYGDDVSLTLCPPKPNCVSTTDDLNDDSHYIPPWTYNPDEGRGARSPVTQAQAMDELVDVVTNTDCDGFETTIVTRLDDYLYVEYKDPKFGFVDDVEFFFAPGNRSRVEYRTAGRVEKAPSAGETQRKRIKALRIALQKKGWKSIGF
jgi:uncharacterized protein (DUF1499 family)